MTYSAPMKYALMSKESTWNTEITPAKDFGLIISDISTPSTREINESKGISSIETQKVTGGIYDPGVSLSGEIQHTRLFELIFGSVSHAETTGDWVHTYSLNNNPPSATIEVGNNSTADTEYTVAGGLVESAELSIALNETLQLSVDFKGGSPTTSTTAAVAILSTLPNFPHSQINIYVNEVEATEVQSASISINKIVERAGGIGSNTYQQGHGVDVSFEYSATIGFATNIFHSLFINGTVHKFKIEADNGVALGSGKRGVSLELKECLSNNFNEVTTVGSLTFVELSGIGRFSSASGTDNISDVNY